MQAKTRHINATSVVIAMIPMLFTTAGEVTWAAPALSVGDVSVVGQKASRSNSTLNKAGIQNGTAGTAPIQLLNKLPGVNATSGGSLGLYEYATQIYIRGFDKNQIGQVLDGVPLGGGLTAGGAPANRFIDMENLNQVNVSQGSADISSPSNSALGGTIAYSTDAPKNKQTATYAHTSGSYNMTRDFVRYDSGLIGQSKAYISLSNTSLDKWRSKGALKRQHAEFKAVSMLGDSALVFKTTYNDRTDHDYLDINKTTFQKFGRNYGLNTNWTGNSALDQNNYQGWTNGRTDILTSLKLDTALSENLNFDIQPYYHYQKGWGRWNPPYILTVNPVTGVATTPAVQIPTDLSFRESTYGTKRTGVTSNVNWNTGFNSIKVGVWAEDNKRTNGRDWYKTINSAVSYLPDRSQLYYNQFDRKYKTTSYMAYAQDSVSLLDDSLNIDLGVKARSMNISFNGLSNNRLLAQTQSIKSHKYFLPKVGVTYKLGGSSQLFSSYAENFSQLPDSMFTQQTFNTALKPETSNNIDLGYRYDDGSTSFNASYYHIDYKNKLETLTVTAGNRFFGNVTKLSNVGGVRTQGVELSAGQHLGDFFNVYSSLTFNQSKYKNNIQTLLIKGNTVIGQPKTMGTAEINYNNGTYDLGVSGKYVGKRFASRDNTESVSPYTTMDLHMGYNSKLEFGPVKGLSLNFNVNNLLDKSYLSTILGSNQGLNNGGGSTYFVGTPRNISLMLKAAL